MSCFVTGGASVTRQLIGRRGARVVVPPTVEPLTLDEARQHLRIDALGSPGEHPDDAWLMDTIPTAREWCERYLGRSIAPQTLEYYAAAFPSGGLVLPAGPVAGIESVTYVDSDGVTQTLDPSLYVVDMLYEPAALYTFAGAAWPTTQSATNVVRVRYTAGYDLPGDSPGDRPLPSSIKSAIKLVLGSLYRDREDSTAGNVPMQNIPLGVFSLLYPYRLDLGMA
jgi:uncharacterized phiE125 gp8 family phage protein